MCGVADDVSARVEAGGGVRGAAREHRVPPALAGLGDAGGMIGAEADPADGPVVVAGGIPCRGTLLQ
ncbi:hypothetical protein [Streptosporangium lutulentum]|uniref:Uncharacterized protein n=1 Tax=Streptosporangium lutulentum TaxID=1461250 RepID=A0ABT9Q5Q3_9ACTN|nr:hypothetical protein [Streptosporangium lutulentum]MDP9842069.1 hypothetical protein [Streptosporangium lutulentum]